MIGLEAMLRLFPEQEANEKAFTALTRFPRRSTMSLPGRDARRARSGGAFVPAQAAVGLGIHAAPRGVCRVRIGRPPRGLFRVRRRGACVACDPAESRSRPKACTACASCSTLRSPRPRPPASASGHSVTRSPSSTRPTSITVGSASDADAPERPRRQPHAERPGDRTPTLSGARTAPALTVHDRRKPAEGSQRRSRRSLLLRSRARRPPAPRHARAHFPP